MDDLLIAPLNPGTLAAIEGIVDAAVRKEHGIEGAADEAKGASILALAGIEMDLHAAYVAKYGNATYLKAHVGHVMRLLVRDGLKARRCQCQRLHSMRCTHRLTAPVPRCDGHFEEDVPAIDGAKLCGSCYTAEYQARNPLATAE